MAEEKRLAKLEILRADLLRTIKLLGCPSTSQLDASYIEVPAEWRTTA